MSQKYERLKTLLMELFQLDQPDLDFGIYRILHARSAEVTQFLEQDLLPQVKEAFAEYRTADRAEIEKELTKAVEQARALGADPDTLPKVQELRARLGEEAVDIDALEAEVYDHLYSFFRRYYSEGDFLSKRVYKPGVYAIPYEGEEVKLHWANADQYYIKTSEYFRDYAFRLRPEDEKNPMRVHFRLVDAAEGEHGNVKERNGKERRFKLAEEDPIAIEDGELVIRFTYQPDPAKQKDLNAAAEEAILGMTNVPPELADWIRLLGTNHVRADGTVSESTRLRVHLDRYTARNTFDYFIHKDLGGFLRRELDFYIKNEVMHLDDIENETAPRVEQYLAKIKVIRKIASKIIDFLAQIEDFQKKLWLKKKFVTETSYCIRLGIIPEEFYPEIAANVAQREEWVELYAIDEIKGDLTTPGYSDPLTVEFLKAHSTLVVDTRHFPADSASRWLEAIGDLDERTDGVLVHSENFQALSLLQARYRQRIKCVYIDPPYNTGSDGFAYKDQYQHSTWCSMFFDRVLLARPLMAIDGALFTSIDENEQPNLRLLLDAALGREQFVADMVWAAGRKNDSRLVSVSHEYIVAYARDWSHLVSASVEWRQRKKGLDDIYAQYERLKRIHGENYAEMTKALKRWFADLPDSHPAKAHRHYSHVDARGVYFPADISWPGGGGPKYEVLHPRTGKPVKVPSRGWMTSDPEKMRQWIADDLVHFGEDENSVPCIKSYLKDREYQAPYSVFYQDGRAATKRLRTILGSDGFGYPKDETILADIVEMVQADTVLDYFAGSGTTGHAVINLNRKDGGRRKFILVEQADYFDTVLLPRLTKITYAPEWKDGKPKRFATAEEAERSPRIMKVIRLESYEDTLNNLELKRSPEQQSLLDTPTAQGTGRLREEYLLRYMLDVETRGSASLVNVDAFMDPTAYRLKVKRPGSDETREVNVDLLETFNWLIGLRVDHISAPRHFDASFKRAEDPDLPPDAPRRLLLDGRLREVPDGRWWFRTVTGTTPDGRRALVIWRNRPGGETSEGVEADNLVLDEWFRKQGYSSKDSEFDLIYVNGGNNLENLKAPDDTWKVRLIEEDFHRLMFEMEAV